MPPKLPTFEPYAPGASSLPLLVRMPDGERRQVDVAPTASVKELKTSIAANLATWGPGPGGPGGPSGPASSAAPPSPAPPESLAGWDLDFAGSVLNDANNLTDYHIPDVYDHASGLLRTISDSAHTDAGKKVEALDKACAVVAGISRGERDMERLISAVFDDDAGPPGDDDAQQPSLRAMRRRGRSRIPSLNFAALPPLGPLPGARPSPRSRAFPSAPPTPSQLIRKLSASRPDLYDPAAAARAGDTAAAGPGTSSGELRRGTSWFTGAQAAPAPENTAQPAQQPAGQTAPAGSGELKRGNTWFTDVISAIGNSVPQTVKREYDGDGSSEGDDGSNENDVEGDSEDEHTSKEGGPSQAQSKVRDGVGKPEPVVTTASGQEAAAKDNVPRNRDVNRGNMQAQSAPTATSAGTSATPPGNKTSSVVPSGAPSAAPPTAPSAAPSTTPSETPSNATSTAPSNSAPNAAGNAKSAGEAAKSRGVGRMQVGVGENKDGCPPKSSALDTHRQVIGLEPEHGSLDEDVKLPKKRGRKRKNPHLTEEQRKAQRQAQNRESAKLSRIRRKNMTIEYEKRVTTLEGENENLRDTVAALTDRLEILQNLLTISVQKKPLTQQPNAQAMMSAPSVPGAQYVPQTSLPPQVHQTHPHQLTNMQYKNF